MTGHVDFSGGDRALVMVLDYAVMLLDGTGGVPGPPSRCFWLLER